MPLRVDHVGLSVGDLEAASEFYSRAFGFTPQLEFELAPHPIRGLMMRHESGMRLELFQHETSVPGLQGVTPIEAHGTRGYSHFALSGPDIGVLFSDALAAGATAIIEPRPSPEPGVRFAFLADPEGNLVELVELA